MLEGLQLSAHHNIGVFEDVHGIFTAQLDGQLQLLVDQQEYPHSFPLQVVNHTHTRLKGHITQSAMVWREQEKKEQRECKNLMEGREEKRKGVRV